MRYPLYFILLLLTAINASAQKKNAALMLSQADSAFAKASYTYAAERYEAALKDGKIASEPIAWFRMGSCYHNLRNYGRAIAAYSRTEKINSRFPGVSLNLAKVLSVTGDVLAATTKLDSAITNGFGNYKILEQDPDLENIRKVKAFSALRDRAYANSHPCENLPAARAFDFWLGDWDVYLTANHTIKTGFNRITRESGGCVLLESWESQGAHSGVSINYFDPATSKWQQKWAGFGQDILEFYDGEYKENAMHFKWNGRNQDGSSFMGKLTFTQRAADTVRQHSQRSNDGGQTWLDVYDFIYLRRR